MLRLRWGVCGAGVDLLRRRARRSDLLSDL